MALTKATPGVLSKAYVEKTDDTENVLGGTIALTEKIFTISSGAVTPTRSNIVLAAQSGTSDTLDQIVTTSLSDDTVIILSVDTGDTITINDAGGAAGQMHLVDSTDFAMVTNDRLTLMRDGADWYELSRSIAPVSGTVIQTQLTQSTALATTTGNIVLDDSVPTVTECPLNTALNTAITPKNTANILLVEAVFTGTSDGSATDVALCLFEDSDTDAKAGVLVHGGGTDGGVNMRLTYQRSAGSVSEVTFKVGAGSDNGTDVYWNGIGGVRLFGGVSTCFLRVTEIAP